MNPNHYSILSTLGRQHRDEAGLYTFALVYEEIPGYNIWQQSNNPIHEINKPGANYNVTGYNPIDIQAGINRPECSFGGLVNPGYKHTLLTGCPGGSWWLFSIGYTGIYPGYRNIPSNWTTVQKVSLWLKTIVYKGIFTCQPETALFLKFSLFICPLIYM